MSETPIEEPETDPLPEPESASDPVIPQTTSNLLKIKRALDGDDMWGLRMEIAFSLGGKPDTRENRIAVTTACVDKISCDIYGAVTCEGITDEQLQNAVSSLSGEPS